MNSLSAHLPRGLGEMNLKKKKKVCVNVVLSLLDEAYKRGLLIDSNSI